MTTHAMRLCAALLIVTGGVAAAQQPQPSPTPATPSGVAVPSTPAPTKPSGPQATPAAPPAASPSTPPSNELNFELFGEEKKKSPLDEAREQARLAKLEHSVRLRRSLLVWHQAIGFVALGVLAATNIIGTFNYVDKYGGGDDSGKFYNWHLGLAISSTALFTTTGVLALAAPNPYPKPVKLDAALVHKVSMALAAAGMLTQIILGPITAYREGHLDQRDLALAHLITGWSTFGFMAGGVLAYVF
jgi:hypothetical protein